MSGRKVRAGPLGDETPVAMNDLVEIGVFGADEDEPIWLRKFRFDGRQRTFRIVVNEWPRTAGIDPLHKLIDRDLDDNVLGRPAAPAPPSRAAPVRLPTARGPTADSARRDTTRRSPAPRDSAD